MHQFKTIGKTESLLFIGNKDLAPMIYIDEKSLTTGYSSYGYLKDMPLDIVKLDSSLIRGITEDKREQMIVNLVQGYLFSKPVRKKEFEKLYYSIN